MLTTRAGVVAAALSLLLSSAGWCGEGRPTRLGHPKAVFGVVFAPDGRTLYTAGDDGLVRAWDVRTGRELRRFPGHTRGVLAIALAADGKTLASAGRDSTVRLWETRTGRQSHTLTGLRGDVEALAISADGRRLAASSSNRSGEFRRPLDGKIFR